MRWPGLGWTYGRPRSAPASAENDLPPSAHVHMPASSFTSRSINPSLAGFNDLHAFAFLGKNPRIGTASDFVFSFVPSGPLKQLEMFFHAVECCRNGLEKVRLLAICCSERRVHPKGGPAHHESCPAFKQHAALLNLTSSSSYNLKNHSIYPQEVEAVLEPTSLPDHTDTNMRGGRMSGAYTWFQTRSPWSTFNVSIEVGFGCYYYAS